MNIGIILRGGIDLKFFINAKPESPDPYDIVLIHNNWDDWFDYSTLYHVDFYDDNLALNNLGAVKIACKDIQKKSNGGSGSPNLQVEFKELSNNFFSLGQDIDYYRRINDQGDEFRSEFLSALKDIAFNEEVYNEVIDLPVTTVSLLRSVPTRTVINDYRKVAFGQSPLTKYEFKYLSALTGVGGTKYELEFNVIPNALPPTNIHVITGRNGVGKTHLISNMIKTLTNDKSNVSRVGKFNDGSKQIFANIVAVSFSAFDNLDISKEKKGKYDEIRYKYIGLKKEGKLAQTVTKNKTSLTNEFFEKFKHCMISGRKERWIEIISILNSDPIFENVDIVKLADYQENLEYEEKCKNIFKRLSSGHAIVLLTLTGLVSTVEQKTLVLLDEPEAHLHPPLLAAFIRALSKLLSSKNGVAIIATHSPVVLQEVPKSCVWRLDRYNKQAKAERLSIETFGANIGTLTREVFGYEVTNSGFHSILQEVAREVETFEEAVNCFNGALGDEALGILRGIMHYRGDNHGDE